MYATDAVPGTELSLTSQKLCNLRGLEDLDMLERQARAGDINSQFILSVMLEDHFKPFLEEILNKVVMNG